MLLAALGLLSYEKYVPRPLTDVHAVHIKHLCAITKLITLLISSPRFLIVEADCINTQRLKRVKLTRLRYAVVVGILPKTQ